ncbi:hypothetical protein EGR_08181 [Echinococcus granulosus]|uniref:Uncharacterized protein n=1 Tax=Echinococcus granulosus TaxID=6210 RepID=W6UUA1_ECHGR|nr:hypothetical protein EGR_08181 [Echinococcus granulosus]EUB56944.1 hypothetical protein EGR_08181 [Echinococcus granulosus]
MPQSSKDSPPPPFNSAMDEVADSKVLELDSFNFVDMRPDSSFALPSVIWLKVPYTGVLHTTQLLVPTINTQR